MVQSKAKGAALFAAFVLPALALYGLFMIYPFLNGIAISFTNWDGLTPRAPISMPKAEFEERILDKVRREPDRQFLAAVYSLDPVSGAYERLQVQGSTRARLYRILDGVHYRPDGYRFVGLDNYRRIFGGGVDERFYPRPIVKRYFNADSRLPDRVEAKAWRGTVILKKSGSSPVEGFYSLQGDSYVLRPEWDEFSVEDGILLLPELAGKYPLEDEAERLMQEAITAGRQGTELPDESAFAAYAGLSAESATALRASLAKLRSIGEFKEYLASAWMEKSFDLGVVGFTAFFAIANVVGANLLGFLLALALDRKLKTKSLLRSVFFMPNVLSMIVVALVWAFIFYNLLPALTGIDTWMGDADKAPWLIAMVSIWQCVGYYMVIYLAGLQNVPQDVNEAAMMDGATGWTRLRHIVLPLRSEERRVGKECISGWLTYH